MQRKKYIPPLKVAVALTDDQSAKFDVLAKVWCNARNFCLYRLNEDATLLEPVLVDKIKATTKFPLHDASDMLIAHAAKTAKILHSKWRNNRAPEPPLVQPEDAPFVRFGDRAHGIGEAAFRSPDLGRVHFNAPLPVDPQNVASISIAVSKNGHSAHLVITQSAERAKASAAVETY